MDAPDPSLWAGRKLHRSKEHYDLGRLQFDMLVQFNDGERIDSLLWLIDALLAAERGAGDAAHGSN